MAALAEQVQGERMARMALSMIAEPNDSLTGYVLNRHGGVETLRLVESDDEVPGLARPDMLMWRERLAARVVPGVLDQVAQAERNGFGTLIPADKEWPAGLSDLGDRAPYLLWTRGAASFLTAALSDRATITGAGRPTIASHPREQQPNFFPRLAHPGNPAMLAHRAPVHRSSPQANPTPAGDPALQPRRPGTRARTETTRLPFCAP